MTEANLISLFIVAGAGLFFYLYYVYPRRFDRTDRPRTTRLPWYAWVDQYLKITSLLIPLLALQSPRAWLLLTHDSSILRWLGLTLAALGCALLAWAMGSLAEQFSPCDSASLPTRVVQAGPYRWVRHPIYAANLVLLAGLAVMTGSLWLVANWFLLLACYLQITRQEEALLRSTSPEYAAFADARGKFLPRLDAHRRAS